MQDEEARRQAEAEARQEAEDRFRRIQEAEQAAVAQLNALAETEARLRRNAASQEAQCVAIKEELNRLTQENEQKANFFVNHQAEQQRKELEQQEETASQMKRMMDDLAQARAEAEAAKNKLADLNRGAITAQQGEKSPVRRRPQPTTEKVSADGEEIQEEEDQQETTLELNAEANLAAINNYTAASAAQTQQLVEATNSLDKKLQSANSFMDDAAASTNARKKTAMIGCKTSVVVTNGTARRADEAAGARGASRADKMTALRNQDNSVQRLRGMGNPVNDDSRQQQHSNGSSGNASAGQH